MDESRQRVQIACETYEYHGQLGLERIDGPGFTAVRDRDNPQVWDSNHIFNVSTENFSRLSLFADDVFAHCDHRTIRITPNSPPALVAYLVLSDYIERDATLQLVLSGPIQNRLPTKAEIHPVMSDEDWRNLFALVRANHSDAARQGAPLAEEVTLGMIESYRRKAPVCQFFLAYRDGAPCAYGSSLAAPSGMGMVEDLFTLPEMRRQGLASAMIAHCVGHARSLGSEDILIGAHAEESPKYLYHKLGFEPVCITRTYGKNVAYPTT